MTMSQQAEQNNTVFNVELYSSPLNGSDSGFLYSRPSQYEGLDDTPEFT